MDDPGITNIQQKLLKSKFMSIILNIILGLIIIIMAIKWPKVVIIKDKLPKVYSPKNCWMQLQNEGAEYLEISDDEVKLKIVK